MIINHLNIETRKERIFKAMPSFLHLQTTESTHNRQQLVSAVIDAFAHTTLGNGIGFFEADCIDDYLNPHDKTYQYWRQQDERIYWDNIFLLGTQPSHQWPVRFHPCSAICFMDKLGQRFALPCYLLWELENNIVDLQDIVNNDFYMNDLNLNPTQQSVVLAIIDFLHQEALISEYSDLAKDWQNNLSFLKKLWYL